VVLIETSGYVTSSGPQSYPALLGYVGWRSQTAGFTTSLELANNFPLAQLGNDTTKHHRDQNHQSQYKLPLQPLLPASANVLYNDEMLGPTAALNFASSSVGINDHERNYPHVYHQYYNPRFPQHYTTLWQIADVRHSHGLPTSAMTITGKLGSILLPCGCCRLGKSGICERMKVVKGINRAKETAELIK
jgi:hypothetical protein